MAIYCVVESRPVLSNLASFGPLGQIDSDAGVVAPESENVTISVAFRFTWLGVRLMPYPLYGYLILTGIKDAILFR